VIVPKVGVWNYCSPSHLQALYPKVHLFAFLYLGPSMILSIIADECVEARILRQFSCVRTIYAKDMGATNPDSADFERAYRRLREIFPNEAPDLIYCYSDNPELAYKVHYICSTVFGRPISTVFFMVKEFFAGMGRVVFHLDVSGSNYSHLSAPRLFELLGGRTEDDKRANSFIGAFLLRKATNTSIHLAAIEELVEKLLQIKAGRSRATFIWKNLIQLGFAKVSPAQIHTRTDRIVRVLTIRPTDSGLAWALNMQSYRDERFESEDIESIFSGLEKLGTLVESGGQNPLAELCPVINKNQEVFSLSTLNFIPSEKVLLSDVPGDCPFSSLRIEEDNMLKIVEKLIEEEEKNLAVSLPRLYQSGAQFGKQFVLCASPGDAKYSFKEGKDTIVRKLQNTEFYYPESCPYRLDTICMVQCSSEFLKEIKDKVPPDLARLKFAES
jgi:hypothetical protein